MAGRKISFKGTATDGRPMNVNDLPEVVITVHDDRTGQIKPPTEADAQHYNMKHLHRESRDNGKFYKDSDCLVVAVMTHGDDGGVLYAKDDTYQVETLWNSFMGERFPEMAGKPKIFLVQACRGRRRTKSVTFDAEVTVDSLPIPKHIASYTIPSEADVLIVYSTLPGKVAHRNTGDGTWFIQELCNQLEETAKTEDMLSLLTQVNRRVAIDYEHETFKQMPVIQSTLTRKICFGAELTATTPDCVDSKQVNITSKPDDQTSKVTEKIPIKKKYMTRGIAMAYEKLQPVGRIFAIPTKEEQTLKIANALKMFLDAKTKGVTDTAREDGYTILHLMSSWKGLSYDSRCFAYQRMVEFLKVNATEWPYYSIIDLPDVANARRSIVAERRRRLSLDNHTFI